MGIFYKVLDHLSKHTFYKQAFSKQKHSKQKQSKAKAEVITQEAQERLLAQIHRYASLIRLQDERQLVEILLPGHTDSFQSMIIGVDLYHQQLIIDDFSPAIHNREALLGQTLTLRHQHNRQMLQISSEVLGWEEDSQAFLLKLPEEVTYQPRRQSARLFLAGHIPLSATINPLYGAPWYASVSNISSGGMRVVVTGDLRQQLHKHKRLKHCELMLDDNTLITCRGLIKSFRYHGRPYKRTDISIAFESLSEEDRLQLDSFIERLSIAA